MKTSVPTCRIVLLLAVAAMQASNCLAIESIRDGAPVDLSATVDAFADQWPRWRGHFQNGKSEEQVPTSWSGTENIAWRSPVPGRGHSSPVVTDDSILLTTADEKAEKQQVVCYDRKSGKQKWIKTIHTGGFMDAHKKNSQASSTPAWDGERLHVVFANDGALWVTALDSAGDTVWQTNVGPFKPEHGFGASPAIFRSLLIVNGDHRGEEKNDSYVAALDRATGKTVWLTSRERVSGHGSYASPIVVKVADRHQVLLPGHGKVSSYDPMTGDLLWFCDGPADVAAYSMAFSQTDVIAVGGYPEKKMVAIRADGSGDVTETEHIRWRAKNGITFAPSPVLHEGRIFYVNDKGVAYCTDVETGKTIWRERLGGNFSASLIFANGLLYASNESGTTYVFKAASKFEMVAENKLGNGFLATPAVCKDCLYLRTNDELCCIRN